MGALEGRTIVVTGASRGMGESMARRFASEGANAVLVARDRERLETVADEVDGETLVAPADVTDADAVRGAVDAAIDAYGAVTGLVNNAGIGLLSLYDERRELVDVEEDDWRRILDVNLTGAFLCAKHAVPSMLDAGRGNVINVSSGLGRRAAPGFGPYVASKWGLEGLTGTLAYELDEEGINVNAIDPGGRVETGFWDHLEGEREDVLEPDVMNDAAVLLAAQGPDGTTGESMPAAEWESELADSGASGPT